MKLKHITLGLAAALLVGSIGIANAAIITDGSFANTSGFTSLDPSSGGYTSLTAYTAQQAGYDGFALDNWTASGYTIQYNNIADATGASACGYTQYHTPTTAPNGTGGGPCSTLWDVGATLPGGAAVNSFVALDGLGGSIQGSVKQQLTGLTVGSKYTLTFYWGGTQEVQAQNQAPSSDQYLQVSLDGSASQTTNSISTPLGSFTGWNMATMTFTANEANPWLTFLAFGQPQNGPPMITLTGVSMSQNVPEPPELAMFGIGLLGLGLLTVFARRRALRKQV